MSISSSDYSSINSESTKKYNSIKSSISDSSIKSSISDSSKNSIGDIIITPEELQMIESKIRQDINNEIKPATPNLLQQIYNTFITATNHISDITNIAIDKLYSKLILAINTKLAQEIKFRTTLETEIRNLELEISDIAHKEYAVDFISKNKYTDPYKFDHINTFLFKTPEGIKTVRKIHKHYLIDYYVLKYGNYKNEKKLQMIYEDGTVPIQIKLDINDETPSNSDIQKTKAFNYNIVAYFAQALCYDEISGKGIDLLLNEFTDNIAENNTKILSILNDICIKGIPLTKKKRSKFIMDDAETYSPGDINLHHFKKYKLESKISPSITKKSVKKMRSKYISFLNPKKTKKRSKNSKNPKTVKSTIKNKK